MSESHDRPIPTDSDYPFYRFGESFIKPEQRIGTSADVAAQAHKDKVDYRDGSGKQVQSAHMVPTVAVSRVHEYSRSAALTVLLPIKVHMDFDSHWREWATLKRREGITEVTVSEWEMALNRALESVHDIPACSANTMSFMIRTELYQTLGLRPSDLLPLPRR